MRLAVGSDWTSFFTLATIAVRDTFVSCRYGDTESRWLSALRRCLLQDMHLATDQACARAGARQIVLTFAEKPSRNE